MSKLFITTTIAIALLSSCIPNRKVVYLQNKSEAKINNDSLINMTYPNYRLQIGDFLNISVKSSDPSITQIFQSSGTSNVAGLANSASDINFLNGFPIDLNGFIDLPLVGEVYLDGVTLSESQEIIESEIRKYVTDAFVQVRLGGIRYTALGECNRPGRYSILQSNVTIYEAIANAGDLTVLANRKKVHLIRQYPGGIKTHKIDLTAKSLLTSEFYFVKPNDQFYFEPLPVRQFGSGIGVTGFQTFTSILSALSSAVLFYVTINNLN